MNFKFIMEIVCSSLMSLVAIITLCKELRGGYFYRNIKFWLNLFQWIAFLGVFISPVQLLPLQFVFAIAYIFSHVYSIRLSVAEGVPWFSIAVLLSSSMFLTIFLSLITFNYYENCTT